MLHFIHILLERMNFRIVAQDSKFQPETREDGPEIMRHTSQHGGALFHMPCDAPPHIEEAQSRRPDFRGAPRPVGRRITAKSEVFCSLGQFQDGPDLVAQKQGRDGQQQSRGSQHEQQEKRCAGGAGPVSLGLQLEYQARFNFNLNLDLAVRRIAVEPERTSGFAVEIFLHLHIKQRIKRRLYRWGKRGAAQHFQIMAQALRRHAFDGGNGRRRTVRLLINVNHQANLA